MNVMREIIAIGDDDDDDGDDDGIQQQEQKDFLLLIALSAGGLRSCHFCHRLITKLSLLSFPSLTEVTVLSLLYMFFGLKSVPWQYFSCHFKSAEWILFITSVQLEHMTIFIAKQRTSCPLDYKWPFKLILLQSDTSVTSVTSVSVRK